MDRRAHPNIRIIKTNDNAPFYYGQKNKLLKNHLRFFITEGYDDWGCIKVLSIFIVYCPFCGTDLYKYYKDDAYANEIEGVTFKL